jgi:hypothetical protein
LIKPFLRGQDIKRWSPDWQGLWMIVLPSSENRVWPWSATASTEDAERQFATAYPSLHARFLPLAEPLKKRQDKGRFWWELRSCSYYDAFDMPKLLYQQIQFYPAYAFDLSGTFANDKVFILFKNVPYLLALLNSPLMWWHNWRFMPHMKDEALSPIGVLMETLPIAVPTDAVLGEIEPAVERLVVLTRQDQEARRDMTSWLRTEFGVAAPGQRLEEFAGITEDDFVAEVRKRLPGKGAKLTPATLRHLRDGFVEVSVPFIKRRAEATTLERRLSDLVNAAYGLTPEDVALLWETAPPRMPEIARP